MALTYVPRAHFSTDALPERERLDAWRSLFSAHDLAAEAEGFSARIETAQVGPMSLRVMNAVSQGPARSRLQTRRDGLDSFVLHLSRHGYSADTERGMVDVPAGSVSFNDMSQSYRRSLVPETDSVILVLPRASVTSVMPNEDGLHGLVLQGGTGLLLADHLRSLARNSHTITTADSGHIAQATLHMLAACVRPSLATFAEASAPINDARLRAAKRFVRDHLNSPLKIDAMSKALGMSRSQLYRLFEQEGGVARYLARQRLSAIRVALEDPLERRTISELSEAFGFGSTAALSHAFRQAYGLTPRDYRASARGF